MFVTRLLSFFVQQTLCTNPHKVHAGGDEGLESYDVALLQLWIMCVVFGGSHASYMHVYIYLLFLLLLFFIYIFILFIFFVFLFLIIVPKFICTASMHTFRSTHMHTMMLHTHTSSDMGLENLDTRRFLFWCGNCQRNGCTTETSEEDKLTAVSCGWGSLYSDTHPINIWKSSVLRCGLRRSSCCHPW